MSLGIFLKKRFGCLVSSSRLLFTYLFFLYFLGFWSLTYLISFDSSICSKRFLWFVWLLGCYILLCISVCFFSSLVMFSIQGSTCISYQLAVCSDGGITIIYWPSFFQSFNVIWFVSHKKHRNLMFIIYHKEEFLSCRGLKCGNLIFLLSFFFLQLTYEIWNLFWHIHSHCI